MDATNETGWYSADAATFGDRVTGAREARGMTRRELADRLGVRVKTLESWEEDRADPRANKLQMLAGVLGVSLMWLLTGEGDGLEAPPETDGAAANEVRSVLSETRQIRAEIGALAERMGRLEKRLRLIVSEARAA
jgi:transcriptional regulator with XRE-family HTH domain